MESKETTIQKHKKIYTCLTLCMLFIWQIFVMVIFFRLTCTPNLHPSIPIALLATASINFLIMSKIISDLVKLIREITKTQNKTTTHNP